MNDLLSQLPEYEPHPDIWARIESNLNTDEQLGHTMRSLPNHEPKADLWDAIERDLAIDEPTKIRPLWNQPKTQSLWASIAAAAVLVLVGGWLYLRANVTEKVRIEYAVEQTDVLPQKGTEMATHQSSADKRAEDFIAQQCAEQQLACQRPEVHELRDQLTGLTTDQQRIEHERRIFGDDPILVRAQIKIENQRAEVTKELITLLRS